MDLAHIKNIRDRTDAKLRYADIYIEELRKLGANGNDIDRAHQESFLFHLWGAKDSFLIELNYYYSLNLPIEKIKNHTLSREFKKTNKMSNEFNELLALEEDNNSWFSIAKEMRDISTHRKAIPRAFYIGGELDGQVFLRNQKKGQNIERHFVDEFAEWSSNMKMLLQRLRLDALRQNNIVLT
jgi:hypothetical protein